MSHRLENQPWDDRGDYDADSQATVPLEDANATRRLDYDDAQALDHNATRPLDDDATEALSTRDTHGYDDAQPTEYLEDNRTLAFDSTGDYAQDYPSATSDYGQASPETQAYPSQRPPRQPVREPEQPAWGEDTGYAPAAAPRPTGDDLRGHVLRRQKAEYSRIQLVPGLIGWLVALSVAGFLTWIARLMVPALGLAEAPGAPGDALPRLSLGEAGGLVWTVAFAVLYFLAYLVGGYAAGRAARFGGAKQGVSVFLWFLMSTAVATVVTMIFDLGNDGNTMPIAAQDFGGDTFVWCALAVIGTALIALVAGCIGGAWGTRFHRKADRIGFDAL